MIAKFVLICVQALALQSIVGQSFMSRLGAAPWNLESWNSCAYISGASNGGALPVSSASLFPPSGVSIVSENAYEGSLAVAGAVPFLGTVALEGTLPTAGSGAVAYGCGNGDVAMLTEDVGGARLANPFSFPASAPAFTMNPASLLPALPAAAPFAPAAPYAAPSPFAAPFSAPLSAPFTAPFSTPFSTPNPFLAPAAFPAGPLPTNAPLVGPCAWANPFAMEAYGPAAAAASNGGALPVTSASSIPPSGVNLLSDNTYGGALAVTGAIPFLGTIALEGTLPTAGSGSISYGCGNGDVAILAEEFAAAGPFNQMGWRYYIIEM